MPEEKLRGELFGLRATLPNPGACPEDKEEEEERGRLDSGDYTTATGGRQRRGCVASCLDSDHF